MVLGELDSFPYNVLSLNFHLKEARNSFLGLGVYLLKSKFRIDDKLRFP